MSKEIDYDEERIQRYFAQACESLTAGELITLVVRLIDWVDSVGTKEERERFLHETERL